MKTTKNALLACSFLACVGWSASLRGADEPKQAAQPRVHLLVPAYFYPSGASLTYWEQLIEAAAQVPIVAIVNPNSGPGKLRDENYVSIIRRARKARITLVGYVDTNYGNRPLADVKQDIERWIDLYPALDGWFFDQQASDPVHVDYYLEVATFARARIRDAIVVSNPGTICASQYATRRTSDVFCIFERGEGFFDLKTPSWSSKSVRAAALLHQVATVSQMRQCFRAAIAKEISFIYITDDQGSNPWDTLPAYWAKLIEEAN